MIEPTAQITNLTQPKVTKAVEFQFQWLKNWFNDPQHTTQVLLHELGTFFLKLNTLNSKIKYKHLPRLRSGEITKEEFRYWWKIRQDLIHKYKR